MNTYEQFKKLNIDFDCIGIQQRKHYENYYVRTYGIIKTNEILRKFGADR